MVLLRYSIAHVVIEDLDKQLDNFGIRVETNYFYFNIVSFYALFSMISVGIIKRYCTFGQDL